MRAKGVRFASENNKCDVRDLFGQVRISTTAEGNRVNEINMAIDERRERFFGLAFNVLANQLHVIGRHVASNMDADANWLQSFGKVGLLAFALIAE